MRQNQPLALMYRRALTLLMLRYLSTNESYLVGTSNFSSSGGN
jgi:hypothetical protein